MGQKKLIGYVQKFVSLTKAEAELFVSYFKEVKLVGVTFVIASLIFSFKGIDAYYYRVIGGTVLAVVSMHKSEVQKTVLA